MDRLAFKVVNSHLPERGQKLLGKPRVHVRGNMAQFTGDGQQHFVKCLAPEAMVFNEGPSGQILSLQDGIKKFRTWDLLVSLQADGLPQFVIADGWNDFAISRHIPRHDCKRPSLPGVCGVVAHIADLTFTGGRHVCVDEEERVHGGFLLAGLGPGRF